jgi:hypothetical protein
VHSFVIVAGRIVLMGAWWGVSSRRRDLWHVIPSVLAVLGVTSAFLAADAHPTVSNTQALVVGAATGFALFVATRIFVAIAIHWRPFARHVIDAYREAAEEPFVRSLVLSLLVSVPSEEFFFRGLTPAHVRRDVSRSGRRCRRRVDLLGAGEPAEPFAPDHRRRDRRRGALGGPRVVVGRDRRPARVCHVAWTGLMLVLRPRVGTTGSPA